MVGTLTSLLLCCPGLQGGVLEKAGLGAQLTECLQFQEQQAEDRTYFPALGDLGGMPRWEGNLGCQLITQPVASGCIGRGQGAAMRLCHV